jgi:hypothetical protein
LVLQLIDEIIPPPPSGAMAALSALAAYFSVAFAAWRLERSGAGWGWSSALRADLIAEK